MVGQSVLYTNLSGFTIPVNPGDKDAKAEVLHRRTKHEAPPQTVQTQGRGKHERNADGPGEPEVADNHDNGTERLLANATDDANSNALATPHAHTRCDSFYDVGFHPGVAYHSSN